ncbi:hypothetical protein FPQ18DRAFT_418291 [Pyronema domesticum]|uniref:Uncharacterized protein n=1 Tax=Pyronema omphalodes (strain CBS 100304) TaxID=1076935 RepID=U4LFA1_PYROM|nr:hypothetical protein FPQ18DRAFT_418291 [Pyronema domesticum]CCX30222.1 Protein of unknown function [Pyronema omphalodes CBS 100304]
MTRSISTASSVYSRCFSPPHPRQTETPPTPLGFFSLENSNIEHPFQFPSSKHRTTEVGNDYDSGYGRSYPASPTFASPKFSEYYACNGNPWNENPWEDIHTESCKLEIPLVAPRVPRPVVQKGKTTKPRFLIDGTRAPPSKNCIPWLANWDYSYRQLDTYEANRNVEHLSNGWCYPEEQDSECEIEEWEETQQEEISAKNTGSDRSESALIHGPKMTLARRWMKAANLTPRRPSLESSLPPPLELAKAKDWELRRHLRNRPKPRTGEEVFREVVLQMDWTHLPISEQDLGLTSASCLAVADRICHMLSEPSDLDRLSGDAIFDAVHASVKRLVASRPGFDFVSRYNYEYDERIPDMKFNLGRYVDFKGFPFGINDEVVGQRVWVNPGWTDVGLSDAARKTLGPEWWIDRSTGKVRPSRIGRRRKGDDLRS